MNKTRDYDDFEAKRTRSFLVKVCDYGVAIVLLTGVAYSTYLDIEGRFKPSSVGLLAAKDAATATKSAVE